MRWRVPLGINSTSDVCKFCQNWTSRRKFHLRTSAYNLEALYPALVSDDSQCKHRVPLLPDFSQNLVRCSYLLEQFCLCLNSAFPPFYLFEKNGNCTAVQLMK